MSDNNLKDKGLVDDQARYDAVYNLKDNLWVEAGAGTGKTTLLINRLVNLVSRGVASLDQVVAITFTEKAASELKSRLREKLESLVIESQGSAAANYGKALEDIDAASISTIHSFAASLLRERPVEAALDPRFSVLDSKELDDLLIQTWEEWLGEQLTEVASPLARAFNLGCSINQLEQLAFSLYRQRDIVAEGTMPPAPASQIPTFLAELKKESSLLKGLQSHCINDADKGLQNLRSLQRDTERLFALNDQDQIERYLMLTLTKISAAGNQGNWKPKESCGEQKEICRHLNANLEEIQSEIAATLAAELVQWCKEGFLERMELVKQQHGLLDFHDLLLKSRNLLRDKPAVRGYFQEKYRYILIDEFQDTDPLQVDLVFFLAEDGQLAQNWQDAILKKGKLFFVGDPKQSIYRFRRADIEIYEGAKKKVLANGKMLSIIQNFRTLSPLIDWINHHFARLITEKDSFQPAYEQLNAYRGSGSDPALIIIESDQDLSDAKADQVRAEEAKAVVAYINSAVGTRSVIDPILGERKLNYGDIALLFPATTGLNHYEEALRRAAIPYYLEGGKNFYRRPEVIAVKNLLTAIDNPADAAAVVATLRFWGGVSDQELYRYRLKGGRFNYIDESDAEHQPLNATFVLLNKAHRKRHDQTTALLLEELLAKTWYWQRLVLQPESPQILANLQKIIQQLRAWELEKPLTLQSYIQWLDQAWITDREEEESLLHDYGHDMVQILTVHRSKGLEFPLVFLLNTAVSARLNEPFIADRSKGEYYIKMSAQVTAAGYQAALEKEKERLKTERIRLLYVAATRARDCLVIPRYHNRSGAGYWADLDPGLQHDYADWPAHQLIKVDQLIDIATQSNVDRVGQEDQEPELVKKLLLQRQVQLKTLQQKIASASAQAPFYSAGEISHGGRWNDEREDSFMAGGHSEGAGYAGGVAFGSAFHQIMENVSLGSLTPPDLNQELAEAVNSWAVSETAELAKMVNQTLDHPIIKRARGAESFQRELPFVYNLQGSLIEGIVDLLICEEGELTIVDYKTDYLSAHNLEERWQRYQIQGKIYALALHEITGLTIKEILFYFVRLNEVKSIHKPDLDAVKIEIEKLVTEGMNI